MVLSLRNDDSYELFIIMFHADIDGGQVQRTDGMAAQDVGESAVSAAVQ